MGNIETKDEKARIYSGFSGTYNDLINKLTYGWLWKTAAAWIFIVCVLGISPNLGKITAAGIIPITEFASLFAALLLFFLIMAILTGVFFGVFANLTGVSQRSSTLTANMIIATKHPIKNSVGLSYKDIQHLQNISTVEQSSSGWQSGILSVAVIWFLVDNIAIFTNQFETLIHYSEQSNNFQSFNITGLGWSFFWAIACLISSIFAYVGFAFIYDFLGNEPANRAILKASEDAQALLEELKFDKKTQLSLKDKQLVARCCGCVYIPVNKKDNYKFRAKFPASEKNENDFLLLTFPKLKQLPKRLTTKRKGLS